LLDAGHRDLTVLDVSEHALSLARHRLGPRRAGYVRWIEADLLRWEPPRCCQLWHDRAVFHFVTDPTDRERYRELAATALEPAFTSVSSRREVHRTPAGVTQPFIWLLAHRV